MSCTYTHQGQTFTAWEFVDYLAGLPMSDLMKYLPEKARAQVAMAAARDNLRGMADKYTVAGTQAPTSAGDGSTERVVDVFGNGNRVQYFNDKKGIFIESQKYPTGKVKWRAGEVVDGFDQWFSSEEFDSKDSAEKSIRGYRSKERSAQKYGDIPNLWRGEEKKVAKAIIDAGLEIDRFSSSTQSKSKYIYLESGLKIRLADHSLPIHYESPDIDFRYGDNIKALVDEIKKASEGAPTPNNAAIETPEFRNWFGDSKVVDAEGKPMVVYHGTASDFAEFNTDEGAHFGTAPAANERAGMFMRGNVMPVYLSIKNPKRVQDQANVKAGEWGDAIEQAKADGYDGLVYRNDAEDAGSDSYVVFDPAQIKSASGNNGRFDGSNPDIRASIDFKISDFAGKVTETASDVFSKETPSTIAGDGSTGSVKPPHVAAAEQMLSLMDDPVYTYGLRVLPDDFTDPVKLGDSVPSSFVWQDGEITDEEIDGISTAGIRRSDLDSVLAAMKNIGVTGKNGPNGYYFGSRVVLVRGDSNGSGQDVGETIIRDPEVLGEWKKPTNGLSEVMPNEPSASAGSDAIRYNAAPGKINQTDTAAFRKWFGDSKVVEWDGEPQIVYHGSHSKFTAFDLNKAGSYSNAETDIKGIYFSPTIEGAEAWGGNVIPVYLSMKNPFFAYGRINAHTEEKAKEGGFDGVIGAGGTEYVVFDPAQIKSAIGNNGRFDGSNPDIRASIDFKISDFAGKVTETASDVFNKETPSTIKSWIKSQLTQRRPFMLGFLTLDQIADIYGKTMESVKRFSTEVQKMDTEKQKISDSADKVVERWRQLDSKEADKLADIMHEATLMQYDPEAFAPDDPSFDPNKPQESLYNRFNELSEDAQQIYRDVRDDYKKTIAQVRDGLANRIERATTNGGAAAAKIRLEFDNYLGEGPYFPLARFGDFILVSDNGLAGGRIVESFESVHERNKMKAQRLQEGYEPSQIKETTKQDYTQSKDGAAGQFANDVIKHVQALDMDVDEKSALIDNLNQLAISSLPDQSYRKHFMHRKGVAGFSNDAMRAFANGQFHAAHHIAKINHADQLSFIVDEIMKETRDAKSGDVTEPVQVANELKKRLDDIVNPKTGPVAASLGQLGFVMSLGGNLASGITNLSQTPLVTLPWLGAKFGFDKAGMAMSKASKDYFGGKWDKWSGYVLRDNPSLTDDERKMLKMLQDEGKIDLTQAHDLAAVANQNSAQSKGAYARSRAMKVVGWTFHLPEVFNRQVSALAAYRLASESGMSHYESVQYAAQALDRTHFNYAQSNRARHMNGDVMRTLTMFKQYSQQMTYMLVRNTYQALRGESPEVRKEARRLLVGILSMHFMAAGSMGLPLGLFGISTILLPIAGMLLGDEDDPWEWEVEYRKMLAETFGTKGGEVIAHGPLRAVMPWADFAGRVGLGDMWFRPPAKEMEGRAAVEAWMQTLAGPVVGYVGNVGTAAKLMSEGNFVRGVEAMVPKMVAAPMKAARFATDGVQSMKGDDLGVKLDPLDILFTAAGFSPSDTSEMYEARNAIKNREHLLDMRRKQIINHWHHARKAGDSDGVKEANDMAKAFNDANKGVKSLQITPATFAKSAAAKERNASQIKLGAYLSKGRESLRSEGSFADVNASE